MVCLINPANAKELSLHEEGAPEIATLSAAGHVPIADLEEQKLRNLGNQFGVQGSLSGTAAADVAEAIKGRMMTPLM